MCFVMFAVFIFVFASCGTEETAPRANTQPSSPVHGSIVYLTFEEALQRLATDVVIAQYAGRRPFGEHLTEFEFHVTDRILGNAADVVFVYATNNYASIMGGSNTRYNRSTAVFTRGTHYILPLQRLEGAMLNTHDDGFLFVRNIVINYESPSLSTMYNEEIALHASEINFNDSTLTQNQIISFIQSKTVNNRTAREHIRSTDIVDIITGSPYVLIVDVGRPSRLVSAQATRDWMETDIYFVTVVQSLKGDIDAIDDILVVFFAYTVQTGERHIVAVEQLTPGSSTFTFTSRNSLFDVRQLDEILYILDSQYES